MPIQEETAGVGANIWGRAKRHPSEREIPEVGLAVGGAWGGVPAGGGAYLGYRVCQPSPAQRRW